MATEVETKINLGLQTGNVINSTASLISKDLGYSNAIPTEIYVFEGARPIIPNCQNCPIGLICLNCTP